MYNVWEIAQQKSVKAITRPWLKVRTNFNLEQHSPLFWKRSHTDTKCCLSANCSLDAFTVTGPRWNRCIMQVALLFKASNLPRWSTILWGWWAQLQDHLVSMRLSPFEALKRAKLGKINAPSSEVKQCATQSPHCVATRRAAQCQCCCIHSTLPPKKALVFRNSVVTA